MDFNAANINSTAGPAAASASRQVTAHKILQEGSSVPVRVTRGLGGGRYEGFVAGVKVNFSSERALKAGDVFTAIVSGNGSKIILTPQTQTGAVVLQNQNLALLLQSAGLSSDSLSSSIFQMFTQTGLKIDTQLMNRIKNLALRFGGKEKAAAELLVMLAEKGISADEDEIKKFLMQLAGEMAWQEDIYDDKQPEQNQEKLINRLNKKEGAWYLFPFELVQYEGGVTAGENAKSVLGSGNIRLLFNSGKMLKLLNLDCIYSKKRYVFSLGFEGGKCRSLRFNTGEKGEKTAEELKRLFLSADMSGIEITEAELSDIEGNASALESIYTFGGEI